MNTSGHAMRFWQTFFVMLGIPLLLSTLSPLPFAFLMPLSGIVGLFGYRLISKRWPAFDAPLYGWVLLVSALCCASSLWSITPQASLSRALAVTGLLLSALPVIDLARACPPDISIKWRSLFPASVLLIGISMFAEISLNLPVARYLQHVSSDYPLNSSLYNKNIAVFVLMLPVALLICQKDRKVWLLLALLLATAGLGVVTDSQAAQLALIIMPLAWFTVFILPVWGIPLVFGLSALLIILMPWLSPIAFTALAERMHEPTGTLAEKASASMRLENWDFISRRIMTRPLTGFGMDATRSITDFDSRQLYYPGTRIMHPHDMALQIWIEFGAVGAAVALGFLAFMLSRILHLSKRRRALPFILFCGAMVFLLISWSMWAAWLVAFFIYLAALLPVATAATPAHAPS